jgi:hypothetical protein
VNAAIGGILVLIEEYLYVILDIVQHRGRRPEPVPHSPSASASTITTAINRATTSAVTTRRVAGSSERHVSHGTIRRKRAVADGPVGVDVIELTLALAVIDA